MRYNNLRANKLALTVVGLTAVTGVSLSESTWAQQRAASVDSARRVRPGVGQRPVLFGVRVDPSPTQGVFVRSVLPESPAERAGIEEGDYLLSLAGRDIGGVRQFREILRAIRPGERVEAVLWSDGRREPVTVAFPGGRKSGFRPQQPGQEPESDNRFRTEAPDEFDDYAEYWDDYWSWYAARLADSREGIYTEPANGDTANRPYGYSPYYTRYGPSVFLGGRRPYGYGFGGSYRDFGGYYGYGDLSFESEVTGGLSRRRFWERQRDTMWDRGGPTVPDYY